MKKILVPTDFSALSEAAVEAGLELAQKAGAEIHFLHLFYTPIDWVSLSIKEENQYPEIKSRIGHAKSQLQKLKQKAEKCGLKVKKFLTFVSGSNEIDQHIREHNHDFIVLGYDPEGGGDILKEYVFNIVRNSFAPVFVIKDPSYTLKVSDIVFASSFEEDVHIPFLKIIDFADLLGAQIHLLNVNLPHNFVPSDEAEAKMKNFLKKCPRGTCSINIYNAATEEQGIQKFANSIAADLIAITTHGRSGFRRIFSSSITEKLVEESDKPVLSVNINIED